MVYILVVLPRDLLKVKKHEPKILPIDFVIMRKMNQLVARSIMFWKSFPTNLNRALLIRDKVWWMNLPLMLVLLRCFVE